MAYRSYRPFLIRRRKKSLHLHLNPQLTFLRVLSIPPPSPKNYLRSPTLGHACLLLFSRSRYDQDAPLLALRVIFQTCFSRERPVRTRPSRREARRGHGQTRPVPGRRWVPRLERKYDPLVGLLVLHPPPGPSPFPLAQSSMHRVRALAFLLRSTAAMMHRASLSRKQEEEKKENEKNHKLERGKGEGPSRTKGLSNTFRESGSTRWVSIIYIYIYMCY